MAGLWPGETSHPGASESGSSRNSQDRPPEEGGRWYFSRKEIEENSPSRIDGIDLKKETYLRKSYCTFLQDLGMRLKVPQITIATAIIFCHRFFIRQSHAKNDRRTIATVCMFLAGKVEETPRPLKDVILVSYEIIHKKDPAAAQRIKQKEVYEQQKELILIGERVVLATLGFDLNVHHPYKPLVEAIKKFKVAQNALAQVAWNFVNDGLRTSLCLQFKPHHIAAGAIFLAAKFLKVKLPSDGEKVWWQEFDVTPRQLEACKQPTDAAYIVVQYSSDLVRWFTNPFHPFGWQPDVKMVGIGYDHLMLPEDLAEVSNQMLELYEQNRVPPSQGSEVEGSAAGGTGHRAQAKTSAANEEHASKQVSSRPTPENSHADNHGVHPRHIQNKNNENGSGEADSVITDHKVDVETKDNQHREHVSEKDNTREVSNKSRSGSERIGGEDQEKVGGRNEGAEAGELRDDDASHKPGFGRNLDLREGPVSQSPIDTIKIDKDKVKAALEKRKKARAEATRKKEVMDEDDLIERELEDGVELAVEDEKIKRERRQSLSNSDHAEFGDGNHVGNKGRLPKELEAENAEEGEMIDDVSPMVNGRKRKAGSPADRQQEVKKRHDYNRNHDSYADREHRRHGQENHL